MTIRRLVCGDQQLIVGVAGDGADAVVVLQAKDLKAAAELAEQLAAELTEINTAPRRSWRAGRIENLSLPAESLSRAHETGLVARLAALLR